MRTPSTARFLTPLHAIVTSPMVSRPPPQASFLPVLRVPSWDRLIPFWDHASVIDARDARSPLPLRIFNRATLQEFWRKHREAEQPLRAWHHEVESASWRGPADIREHYRTADFLVNNRVIFDIRGNKYRLVAAVKYAPLFCIYVRFLGTHAEYDKIDASAV